MGLGDVGFGDGSQGYGGTLSMVLCLQMGAEASPIVLGFLTELPALGCMDGQPHLVRRRGRLLFSLPEEGRKEAMRGEVEAKSQQEALEEPEEGLSRLSLAPWGSLPALGNRMSHLSAQDNNMALHLYQLLGRLDLQKSRLK